MKKANFVYNKLFELARLRGSPRLQDVRKPYFFHLADGWTVAVQGTQRPLEIQPPKHEKMIVPPHSACLWHNGKPQATILGSQMAKHKPGLPALAFDVLPAMVDRLATEQVSINMKKIAEEINE